MIAQQSDRRRVVLITGATTGIGLALVRVLQRGGDNVVATGRESSLRRFSDENVVEDEKTLLRSLDVTNLDEQSRLIDEIKEKWGGVDVLVNNAGVSYCAVVEDLTPEALDEQFAVNFQGPMNLIRLVLPYMREHRSGHIINVSSVGGMMAMPTMGAYSASKFALEGASESLWYEMRPWGIRVSLIQPGFVDSSSFLNVKMTRRSQASVDDADCPYHGYYENMSPFIARMMERSSATPESIASSIVRTMNQRSPKLRIPATADAWLFYYLRRALPQRLYHYVLFRALPKIGSWVP